MRLLELLREKRIMYIPRAKPVCVYEAEARERKKAEVIRLTEAIIAGGVDLSPEEMVDAAFLMVERINDRIYGKEK